MLLIPQVIFSDSHLALINKPVDLPIHKNSHMVHDALYLTKWAGEHFDRSVYNVHRLDAKTSGVVVVAFDPKTAGHLTQQFERREVSKHYFAIVRQSPGAAGVLNKPVMNKKKGKLVPAITAFKTIKTVQTSIQYKEFDDISLSLVELQPKTGRWHQLRQHMALERNDIVGDNQHGDRTLNHIIEDMTNTKRLYLHAGKITFTHPHTNAEMVFDVELPEEFD
ncbi:MAG: pseudouridine synthase, partial [Salinivirgaceae bacterium]